MPDNFDEIISPRPDFWIRLSQSHLTLLETCPPQFQKIFLEQRGAILNPDQQAGLAWGSQFHHLMQQKILGLPSTAIADPSLQRSLTAIIEATPELWQDNPLRWQEAEHLRTLAIHPYLFSVIYDLLVIEASGAQILDWKTYPMPRKVERIASSWQTRLYLYVLAETSDFLPEQLSMTYWFVQLPNRPQSLTITYNQAHHDQTRHDLLRLLSQLDRWLKDDGQQAIAFPHLADCTETCPYVSDFLPTLTQSQSAIDWQNFLDNTPELPVNYKK
jgi:hypothetical protein